MSPPRTRSIDSLHNPSFKQWRKQIEHPEEEIHNSVPLEGSKQIEELSLKIPPDLIIFSHSAYDRHRSLAERSAESVLVPDRLMDRLSDVRTSQGIIAFFPKPSFRWEDLPSRVLYLDGIQDPGNLGTIIRTAAAAGGWGLVTAPGTVSRFNAKAIRASAGYLFQVPFLERRPFTEISQRGYISWLADSSAGDDLFAAPLDPPVCVVVGREGGGSSRELFPKARRLHIPMAPGVESLNAAVSASLILYEPRRRGQT